MFLGEGADEDLGDGDKEGGEATGGLVMGVGGGVLGVDGGGVDGGGAFGVGVGGVTGLAGGGGGGVALGRVLISSFIPPTLQCPPVPHIKYFLPTEARVITVIPPV